MFKLKKIKEKIIDSSPQIVTRFFSEGHERTLKAKRNITASLVIKVAQKGLGFLLVPISLSFVGQTKYGVWLTVSSFIHWFSFMDVGLGKGLRNKFAESIAENNHDEARKYVSTAYAIIGAVAIALIALFLLVNPFIDWSSVLNTSGELKTELSFLVAIVLVGFALRFVLKLITTLLMANQQPAIRNFIFLLSKIVMTISIFAMYRTLPGSLLKLGLVYTFSPVFLLFVSTIVLFCTKFRKYTPALEYVDFGKFNDLFNLGIKFFIISIAGVVLFQTDNIIITQLFGPEQVTPYQITHKYFGVMLMLFMVVVQPLWSAVTEAFTNNDYEWISNSIRKLLIIAAGFSFLTIVMFMLSPYIFDIWVGREVKISLLLSAIWSIFVILRMFTAIFTQFVNGVSKLKIQLILNVFSIILNIPLSILFAQTFGLGISGVILATSVSMLLNLIVKAVQYKKIIAGEATGIWAQ